MNPLAPIEAGAQTSALSGCSYIYVPKGEAGEYEALAANPNRGCGHYTRTNASGSTPEALVRPPEVSRTADMPGGFARFRHVLIGLTTGKHTAQVHKRGITR